MKNQTDERIRHLHRIIDTTRKIDRLLIFEKTPESIIKNVCDILVNDKGNFFACVLLLNSNQKIEHFAGAGDKTSVEHIKKSLQANNLTQLFRDVLTKRELLIVENVPTDHHLNVDLREWTPFIAPIQDQKQIHGLLYAAIPKKDADHPKERITFTDIANNIGFALSRIQQDSEIEISKYHYKNLIEATKDGIFILQDGDIKFVNSSICELSGYSEGELLGRPFSMLVAPSELKKVEKLYKDKISGQPIKMPYESEAITKSGQIIPVEVTAIDTVFNDHPALQIILRDQTEIKKTLKQLTESETYFRFLSEASFEGIIIHDKGKIIDVNNTLLRISGFSREELIGKNLITDLVVEKDKTIILENIQKPSVKPFIVAARKKDGSIAHIEIEARAIFYKGKNVRIAAVRDISKRFKLQQEVKEGQEKLNRLLDNLPGVAYNCQIDENWSLNFISQACYKLSGYNPEELTGEGPIQFVDLIHPDDRDRVSETINKAVDEKKSYELEYRVQTKQNEERWVWERGRAVYIDDKILLEGFISDITERKKLETSTEMFSEAIASSPVSIVITNANGKIEYVNPFFEEKSGYHIGEVIGKNPRILKSGKQPKAFYKEMWDTINSGKIWFGEFQNKKKSGELHWEQANISPIFDQQGRISHFIAVKEDITEKKRSVIELQKAKETAEQNEKRFKALHNASFGGIAIHDKGVILDCNQGLSRITEYKHEELVGMNGMLLIAEDQREMVMNKILNEYIKPYETYGVRKNGQRYPVRLEGRMIPYNNKMVRVVEFRDITDQKKIEEELINAKEKAEQSDKLKSSFLANMSHEIRTPMNGILGFTELLKEPDLSAKQRTDFVDVIQTSGERMLSTLNDIIDVSKIESGMVNLNMQDINLSSLVNDIYVFFKPSMQKKNVDFIVNENNGNPFQLFHTDPDKVNSILSNLIKNAYKFTSSGTIEFGYTIAEHFIHFYVNDTGVGIPKNRQQAIFDRFVQADEADSRIFEGSGLGLAITKSYVEMLNGEISLKSEVGVGTTFNVTLPLTKPENDDKDDEESTKTNYDELFKRKLKILIAEDDPISVELLKLLLKDIASELFIANEGREVIKIAEENPEINLILMDIKMPVVDGFTATAKIREFNKSVKIIAQSAFAQPEDLIKAEKVGCNSFISKPINKRVLLATITQLFNDKTLQKGL